MIENKFLNKFSFNNIDVSLVNALRRICLANIRTYVIKEDDIDIQKNTTRFNNEILKQRIQCIPVHILDNSDETSENKYLDKTQGDFKAIHPDNIVDNNGDKIDVKNLILKLKKDNDGGTKTTEYVTTQDIEIYSSIDSTEEIIINNVNNDNQQKNKVTLSSIVFSPDPITGKHIVIARLKPPIDTSLPGESLEFTATLSLGTAKENGSFNVVSTCAYENKVDETKSQKQWDAKKKELIESNTDVTQINMEEHNWKLLNGKREQYRNNKGDVFNLCQTNAFDFKIETVGVYSNLVILHKACVIMQQKCDEFISSIEKNNGNHVKIAHNQNTTQPYEFCATLHNEDYTIGNPIVHYIFDKYYGDGETEKQITIEFMTTDNNIEDSVDESNENKDDSLQRTIKYVMKMTFVGFKVPHPHIPDGIIRIIYENVEENTPILDHHKDILIRKLREQTAICLKSGARNIKTDFNNIINQFTPQK